MKQFNFEMTDVSEVSKALDEVYSVTEQSGFHSVLFHLYTIKFAADDIRQVQGMILDVFPDAYIGGTSSNGDICDGHLADYGLVMSVSVFESTDITTNLFKCEPGSEAEVGTQIRNVIDTTDNIKAAEILITLKTINSHIVLDEVEKCREDMKIFGGGSAAMDISGSDTKVMDELDVCDSGVLLITYSGDNFRVDIHHAIGWKPLGKDLTVTKIEDKRLYELDNIPAGKIYSKYLDIHADDDFFANILEFPIMSRQHGIEVLRLPFSCRREDNSILLAADVKKGSTVNLSYGDPDVIRSDVNELKTQVSDFAPQAIFLYSCGVRRLYWKYLINKETGPFSTIAPVSGFYSSGEIMRMGPFLIEHHVTLIAISMREGLPAEAQPTGQGDRAIKMPEEFKIHNQLSMVRRLANFINVTASELRAANEELQQLADTDELTGLYNRRMIDKLVRTGLDHAFKYNIPVVMGIVDVDDFKDVNDTYGHSIGDEVLRTVTKIISRELDFQKGSICGRWGGEEFLFMLSGMNAENAFEYMEKIRIKIENIDFVEVGHKTISIGMTELTEGDTAELLFKRADEALYEAKGSGKNRICVK